MGRCLFLVWITGCANQPDRPITPVSQEVTNRTYKIAIGELKRMLSPKPGAAVPLDWSQRMYLNPVVLLPPADSASPPLHLDSQLMADVVTQGLVRGVCGRTTVACPDTIALVSLGVPWTLGGDTTYVRAGYVGEIHSERTFEGIFYVMTIAPDEEGTLKVKAKSPPENVTFNNR
jgi:hypothetical protein